VLSILICAQLVLTTAAVRVPTVNLFTKSKRVNRRSLCGHLCNKCALWCSLIHLVRVWCVSRCFSTSTVGWVLATESLMVNGPEDLPPPRWCPTRTPSINDCEFNCVGYSAESNLDLLRQSTQQLSMKTTTQLCLSHGHSYVIRLAMHVHLDVHGLWHCAIFVIEW